MHRVFQIFVVMANSTILRLSSKVGSDGKSQVIVKLTIARDNRPCFKSGVFISPSWFKPTAQTKKGNVMGIVPPKKGRFNQKEVDEAVKAKAALDSYVSRLSNVANAIVKAGAKANHETIEKAMLATPNVPTDNITFKEIEKLEKAQATAGEKADMTFFDWYRRFIAEKGKNLSKGRIARFEVVGRMLGRYEGYQRATGNEHFRLDIDAFSKDIAEDFHDYLVNEKALQEEQPHIFASLVNDYPVERSDRKQVIRERGVNVMEGNMKVVREFFNWLNKEGITDNRPFAKIPLERGKYGRPYFLTLEERNKIADTDMRECHDTLKAQGEKCRCTESLEVQRDIFIFQCCVGCRVSDMITFTEKNLDYSKPGKVYLTYIPIKTRHENPDPVRVPLIPRAIQLVDKYKGVDPKGRLFPFISDDKYNRAIKDVLRVCGINRDVTKLNSVNGKEEHFQMWEVASSHLARRTFIGNLYREIKDPNIISSMSGHAKGSKAFNRYRDIDDDVKEDVVSLMK